jgi:ABC-type Mn2+/Zn2+ transport system permease subunit
LGVDAEVIKVQDIKTITNYGVLVTPALVVDGVVKVAGKLLKISLENIPPMSLSRVTSRLYRETGD